MKEIRQLFLFLVVLGSISPLRAECWKSIEALLETRFSKSSGTPEEARLLVEDARQIADDFVAARTIIEGKFAPLARQVLGPAVEQLDNLTLGFTIFSMRLFANIEFIHDNDLVVIEKAHDWRLGSLLPGIERTPINPYRLLDSFANLLGAKHAELDEQLRLLDLFIADANRLHEKILESIRQNASEDEERLFAYLNDMSRDAVSVATQIDTALGVQYTQAAQPMYREFADSIQQRGEEFVASLPQ